MPRNSSGTYSLPSGNPVSSGTLIEASWANSTLSDLASAMTGSLSRAGEGGMTAALRLYDGTVSLPGLAFSNETSTGLYRAGTGDMRLAVTGSQVMQFLTTGVAVTGTLSATGAVTLTGQTATLENATAYYPQLINRNKTNDANGAYIAIEKIRNTSIVQNGDVLGNFIFRGYDGTQYLQGAYINAVVSGTPGTNDMPTDLSFGTTSDGGSGPTERLRISNTGAGTASADWTFYGVKVGRGAGAVSTNTAVGYQAVYSNTTGARNSALGYKPLYSNTTGANNSAFGIDALGLNTTGSSNTAFGDTALGSNTTASNNTAVGFQAAYSNTTGTANTAVGHQSLYPNTTGSSNSAFGRYALSSNTTGSYNTSIGVESLNLNTTAGYNTAVGYQAGYASNYTSDAFANNTFIGALSGSAITTGRKNTIIGLYNGNQGGLDIRTSNNHIVLSDGDGNPRAYCTNGGSWLVSNSVSGGENLLLINTSGVPYGQYIGFNAAAPNNTSNYFLYCTDNSAQRITLRSNGGLANYQANNANLSDRREKTNFAPAKSYLDTICAIPVQTFNYIDQNMEEDPGSTLGVVAQDVQAVAPELVSESNWGTEEAPKMRLSIYQTDLQYALMKALQELKAEFDAYKEAHP